MTPPHTVTPPRTVAVEPLDPGTCSAVDLEGWYACQRAATVHDLPRDPEPTREEVLGLLRHQRHRHRAWAARDSAGSVVGTARGVFDDTTNTHLVELELVVHPAARRRGTGRALLAALADAALAEGRTTLLGGAPHGGDGERFAEAVAAERALTDRRSVQRLGDPEADGARTALCRDAVAAAEGKGFRLVSWTGHCPEELLGGFAAAQPAMHAAPLGTLDYEWERWTPAMLREEEDKLRARDEDMHVTVALDPTGGLVAFTETVVHRSNPVRAYQGDTGVLPASRGQALGLAVKAAQLLRLRELEPAVREVETWNAEANGYMLRINELLGYEREDEFSEWQLRVAAPERQ